MKFTFIDRVPNYYRGSLGQSFELALVNVDTSVYTVLMPKGDHNVVGISDEPYWSPTAPTGELLSFLAGVARENGLQPGICLTPYALPEFGLRGTATLEDFIDAAMRVDVVAIDPYLLIEDSWAEQKLLDFAQSVIDWCRVNNKQVACILQGFAQPNLRERAEAYNEELFKLDFDKFWIGDAIDFWDIPDEWQIDLIGLPDNEY